MENKILIDFGLLKKILNDAANNIVGKICKRFEILKDKDEIKSSVKELLHEHNRDLYKSIMNSCKGTNAIFIRFNKKGKEE